MGNGKRTQKERLARFNANDAVNSEEMGINEGVTSNEHYTITIVARLEPDLHSRGDISFLIRKGRGRPTDFSSPI